MNIGSSDGMTPAVASEMAATMAERVRSAHEAAGERCTPADAPEDTASSETRDSIDTVGAKLRADLEALVDEVVSTHHTSCHDIVGEVVELIVADQVDRGDLAPDEQMQRQLVETMRSDPVIIGEIDDILQEIARQLALQNS